MPKVGLRIEGEGELGAGDAIEVVLTPAHGVTIGQFAEAYLGDRDALVGLLAADELAPAWREWIAQRGSAPAGRPGRG